MFFGPWLQIRLVEIDIQLLFAKRTSLSKSFMSKVFMFEGQELEVPKGRSGSKHILAICCLPFSFCYKAVKRK